jgi:hypothetical protein
MSQLKEDMESLLETSGRVKLTGLTVTQMHWVSEYKSVPEEDTTGITLTRTTATMPREEAEGLIYWLKHDILGDHLDAQEYEHDTPRKVAAARRTIEKSFATLVKKIQRAMR